MQQNLQTRNGTKQDQAQAPNQTQRTILLVEDDNFVRDATCDALASAGFGVLTSRNAREAVEKFGISSPPIQLLITDLVLPDRNGYDLAAELLSVSEHLKILYISGHPQRLPHGHDAGANSSYLQKPFSRSGLLEKVGQALAADSPELSKVPARLSVGKP